MERKIWIIILSVVTVGLFAAFFILSSLKDTEGPVISYDKKKQLVYDESMDASVLLEDVTARDDVDGDVTDSLMVQNVIYSSDAKGVVIYVAIDQSNNVTIEKRKFIRQVPAPEEQPADAQVSPEQPAEESQEAVPAMEQQPEGEIVPGSEEFYAALKQQQLEQGLPFLRLNTHEVTIDAGTAFIIQNYIAEIENCGEDPYQRIRLDGDRVNTRQAGTYQMKLYVTDTNDQKSNEEQLTVVVQ